MLGREFSLRYGLSTTDVNGLEFVLHDAVGQQVMRQRLSSVSGRWPSVEGLPPEYISPRSSVKGPLRTERLVLGSPNQSTDPLKGQFAFLSWPLS